MMARSTNALQAEAGYIDARPHQPGRGSLLHRTAGQYIRVKMRRTHCEQMSSGLAPTADIDERCRHFRDVPEAMRMLLHLLTTARSQAYSITSSARASSDGHAREGISAYPRPALGLAASSIRFCATTSTSEFVRSCDAGNAQASIRLGVLACSRQQSRSREWRKEREPSSCRPSVKSVTLLTTSSQGA
jgi:hypothetical protein